jgi:hypothetical protein
MSTVPGQKCSTCFYWDGYCTWNRPIPFWMRRTPYDEPTADTGTDCEAWMRRAQVQKPWAETASD